MGLPSRTSGRVSPTQTELCLVPEKASTQTSAGFLHVTPNGLAIQTQKPEALLDRIIQTSSAQGDVVLDPFCGCGTTVAVAEQTKREWVGIDIYSDRDGDHAPSPLEPKSLRS